MSKQLEIFYLDNVLQQDWRITVTAEMELPRWTYKVWQSNEGFEEDNVPCWIYDWMKSDWNTTVYRAIIDRLEEVVPRTAIYEFKTLESYASSKTFGQDGLIHNDKAFQFNAVGDGFMTFIYFPGTADWDPNWGGEFQFFDEAGNVIATYYPQPNTCLVFDSNIPHRCKAPTINSGKLKKILNYNSFVHKRWDLDTNEIPVEITEVPEQNS